MTKALIRLFIRDAENTRDARVRERYGVLSGAVGIACNVFLFILKVVIGLVTGSISIAADAFNNLSDGLSCMISIVGFKVSGKAPDEKHPFGYGRTEYIAGLVVAFIIVLVGFEFFKTSIDRILHPAPVAFSLVLVVILAISMLVKLWMGAFNVQIGRRIDSPVLMAAGQDSRNDVITTGVVILGMVAGQFTTLRWTAMWACWWRRSSSGRASALRATRLRRCSARPPTRRSRKTSKSWSWSPSTSWACTI